MATSLSVEPSISNSKRSFNPSPFGVKALGINLRYSVSTIMATVSLAVHESEFITVTVNTVVKNGLTYGLEQLVESAQLL